MDAVLPSVDQVSSVASAVRPAPARTGLAIYGSLAAVTVVVVALIALIGYPFFILFALTMSALGLVGVATIAAADLLDKAYFAEHARRTKGRAPI